MKKIVTILFIGLCVASANARTSTPSDDDYEVVRDTIAYTSRPEKDTSDPMKYVVNNPAKPPKGSAGLSHTGSQTSAGTQSAQTTAQSTQTTAQSTQYKIHVVKNGEVLGQIAKKYHVSVNRIVQINNLRSADRISVGQKLKIPQ